MNLPAAASQAIVTGQFCEVAPDVQLHYATCGEASRPAMLLIHGFPEFWYAWRSIMPALGEHFHVIAPDLRGYNLSSKPAALQDYKPGLLIRDLVTLIEKLGRGKACVVAHDWGGALAWSLASMRPDLVSRLVIINAPHPVPFARALVNDPEQRKASEYMNWLRRPGSEGKLAENSFARLEAFLSLGEGPGWFDANTREAYHQAWGQPGALTGGVNYYRASPLHPPLKDQPGAARLQLQEADFVIRVPTLVIWGEADRALRPVLLEGLERMVPSLRIHRVPGATHWIVHEQPALVSRLILAHCTDAP